MPTSAHHLPTKDPQFQTLDGRQGRISRKKLNLASTAAQVKLGNIDARSNRESLRQALDLILVDRIVERENVLGSLLEVIDLTLTIEGDVPEVLARRISETIDVGTV